MTGDTDSQRTNRSPADLLPIVAILAVVLGGVAMITVAGTPVAAGEDDYYNNSSSVVQPDAPENVTLANLVDLAVKLSPDLIGAGEQDPSATGFQGVLLTGLTFAFVGVGAMIGTGVGTIGGTTLGLAVSYGLVDAGFAPPWIKPLLLFGLGIVVFTAIRKAIQGR